MIDFASITKTLDGYTCHYFGTRDVFVSGFTSRVHCMAVWHPVMGVFEKLYDDQGYRLSVIGGQITRTQNKKYRIVEASDGN
jgi:hypothetical protein